MDRVDHVALALERLPAYLRDKPRWRELLTVLVTPLQEIEDATQAVILQRNLDDAEGAQVDQLGAIVGEARAGATDAVYRRRIRARIAVNLSRGLSEDLIRIARLIVYDAGASIEIEQQDVATVVVRIGTLATDAAVAADVIAFLRVSASAGVRVLVEYSPVAPANTFTLDGTAAQGFPAPYTLRLVALTGSAFETVLGAYPGHTLADVLGVTLTFVASAGAPQAGTLNDTWPSVTYTWRSAAPKTTIADFEAAIAASVWYYVTSFSFASGEFSVGDDEFAGASWATDPIDGGAFAGILE